MHAQIKVISQVNSDFAGVQLLPFFMLLSWTIHIQEINDIASIYIIVQYIAPVRG
jgi:hypothetical protein